MEELEKNETSTQAEENTVSLASAQALADALAKIEAYTPTTWVDNSSPDIDAEHLNKPEQAIKRVTDALNSAVDVIKDLQSQVTKNAGDISTVNNNLNDMFILETYPYESILYVDSTVHGFYSCDMTLKDLPVNRYGMALVCQNQSGKWIFIIFVPTSVDGLYLNFYNGYSSDSAGWSGWYNVPLTKK